MHFKTFLGGLLVPVLLASTLRPAQGAEPSPHAIVHVESARPVVLEHRTEAGWETICDSPCDTQVAVAETYRINGSGVRSSAAFDLDGRLGERITIQVDPGSTASKVGGIAVVSLGGAIVIAALTRIVAGLYVRTLFGDSYEMSRAEVLASVGGVVVGAAVVVAGVAVLRGGRTTLAQVASASETAARDARGGSSAAWRTPSSATFAVPAPRVTSIPIFGGSF